MSQHPAESYTSLPQEPAPEPPAPAEQLEDLAELDFDLIQPGDRIFLFYTDGRADSLEIDERDDEGSLYAKLSVGKKLQLSEVIEQWEDNPHKIKLKGACRGLLVDQGQVTVDGPRSGCFIAGEKAWLGFTVESGDKEMVRGIVERLTRVRAGGVE